MVEVVVMVVVVVCACKHMSVSLCLGVQVGWYVSCGLCRCLL